jgi:hypothetical protein
MLSQLPIRRLGMVPSESSLVCSRRSDQSSWRFMLRSFLVMLFADAWSEASIVMGAGGAAARTVLATDAGLECVEVGDN